MKVLYSAAAQRQLESLFQFISKQAGDGVAGAYVNRIVAFCDRLGDFPLRGAARDDVMPGLRTIGFERRATVAFTVLADAVLIEGVFYGGRDFEAILRK